jgi:transcriptional regulator with XRE-family HTH domain
MAISSAQCRAGRALLNWSQSDLEKAAQVAKKTIADFEREARTPYERTLNAICVALEAAGIEFLPDNGVRLRTRE